MADILRLNYTVDAFDLSSAGEISKDVSNRLETLKVHPETIRRCSLALYEGEINMIVHANGGNVEVSVDEDKTIIVTLKDTGNGIENVEEAMGNGYTTIPKDSTLHQKGIGEGQGLSNMSKYSDYIYIQSEVGVGTTVTMVFK
jgi:anti-sigma regulatory factor (Ser/Thr protein kinase)